MARMLSRFRDILVLTLSIDNVRTRMSRNHINMQMVGLDVIELEAIDVMKALFCFTFLFIVESSTIGRKIKVPNSDHTLQELIYRSALPRSNEQIQDSVWWVPNGDSYQATKVTVLNEGKQYSTYSFQMVLVKSQCDAKKVPISSLRKCKPAPRSNLRVFCQVMLAWNENDWSSIEMENYCSRK
ncbi:hypothetical protein RB195_019027 [Necator americanus]|uniref:Uncharacterized protein n=1 Tax=Necator americanus TaxID=51031 RepID=A0ABR1CE17_NECAM